MMTVHHEQAPLDLTGGNPVKQRLVQGLPVLNLMIRSSRTTDIVRIARASGHHAVTIDLEHSTMSLDLADRCVLRPSSSALFRWSAFPNAITVV
jgi:hypothetical protein